MIPQTISPKNSISRRNSNQPLLKLPRFLFLVWFFILFVFVTGCGDSSSGGSDDANDTLTENQAEILRDTYGVPHVFAGSLRAAAYSWGYVHAEDRREEVLAQIYAGSGRSASIFGHNCGVYDCASLDILAKTYDIPTTSHTKYETLNTTTRLVIEAYAAGVNLYFENLQPPLPNYVMPVTAEMVVGSMGIIRIIRALSQSQADMSDILKGLFRVDPGQPASNQFAATGKRTAPGTTIYGSDPHSSWALFRSEPHIHLHFSDFDIVGASGLFVGPEIECGGNNFVHYGCTSLQAAATVVQVRAQISQDGTAYFDHQVGGFVPFDQKTLTVEVAGEADINLTQAHTRFGPVYKADAGDAIIVKIFAAGDISEVDYQVGRWLVRSVDEFVALFDRPTPAETGQNRVIASADKIGHIYGAYVPVLNDNLDWSQPVSSADPSMEWTPEQWHNIDGITPELPYVLAPEGDFAQNCNGHPAWSNEPIGQISTNIPRYLNKQNGPSPRGQRMRALLTGAQDLDVSDAQAIITDIKAQRADDLIEALRRGLASAGISDPSTRWGNDVGDLVNTLLNWRQFNDYQATTDSEAMTVLYHFIRIAGNVSYPAPGTTFSLAKVEVFAAVLAQVATYMNATYATLPNPLQVPWGYINRVKVGSIDVSLPGAPSSLTLVVSQGTLHDDGRTDPDPLTRFGSFMLRAASFGPNGLEHYVALARGQIAVETFPNSPHVGQTIKDFAERKLRRIWLERSEVEANLCPYAGQPGHEHPARTLLTVPD